MQNHWKEDRDKIEFPKAIQRSSFMSKKSPSPACVKTLMQKDFLVLHSSSCYIEAYILQLKYMLLI